MEILVINGPNLNMLGIREPEIYGRKTYKDLEEYIKGVCEKENAEVDIFQSNHEGAIIDRIQQAYFEKTDGIVINPAAYTHTSVGILDALKGTGIPTVEVHLSDVNSREDFRKISYVSLYAAKKIWGLGFEGYKKAIEYIINTVNF